MAPWNQNNMSGLVEATECLIPTGARHIAGAGTTVVKAGSGRLHRLIINKAIGSSVVTIYDGTSTAGAVLAVITMPAVLLHSQVVLDYGGMPFANGLTIVTSAADDLTVVYA